MEEVPVASPPDAPPKGPETAASTEVRSAPLAETSSARPAAPPARLATAAWLGRLASEAAAQSVRIALDDGDGSVRLQTRQEAEAVAVQVRFSDPELQALAAAHVGRLRETLEAHFDRSVRLSLDDRASADGAASDGASSDGASADGGADRRDGRSEPAGRPGGPSARPTSAVPPPSPRSASGRREWVG